MNENIGAVKLLGMKAKPKFDFPKFLKHFIWGCGFGALVGLSLWLISTPWGYTDLKLGFVCIISMTLLLGCLAGFRRGRFWENAIDWLFPW